MPSIYRGALFDLFAIFRCALSLLVIGSMYGCAAGRTPGLPHALDNRTYQFRHGETTGISTEVLLEDNVPAAVMIEAQPGSEAALDALYFIRSCGIDGNWIGVDGKAGRQRIFVVGKLSDESMMTAGGTDRPAPEPYRQLVLQTWFIAAPFTFQRYPKSWLPGDPAITVSTSSLDEACAQALASSGATRELNKYVVPEFDTVRRSF